jgi:DNA-binding GntR family transcriptional regulator
MAAILSLANDALPIHALIMDFKDDLPRWVQVAEVIEARIKDGTYPAGARVPSVVQLTGEFGIASATAQKALRALKERGLTRTVVGMGSFVR